jgi:hypothetical protein
MKNFVMGLLLASASAVALSSAAQAQAASSYSKAVQQFCRADYKKYCGEYGLETTALRACMSQAEVNRHK